MKYTLQSLLITTVLALPTVFGSEPLSGFEDESTTDALATPESNPQVSVTAQFKNMLTNDSFDDILNAAFDIALWTMLMTPTQHTDLVVAINEHRTFIADEKIILKGLLPNATPTVIECAADKLSWCGTAYHHKTEALYKLSANHPDATPENIREAAYGLDYLGFTDSAAALYKLSAKHAFATAADIRLAASGLQALGSKYPDGSPKRTKLYTSAAELFEQSGHHRTATQDDIWSAAAELEALGYDDRADALRKSYGRSN